LTFAQMLPRRNEVPYLDPYVVSDHHRPACQQYLSSDFNSGVLDLCGDDQMFCFPSLLIAS
jgi:hypothetical protein